MNFQHFRIASEFADSRAKIQSWINNPSKFNCFVGGLIRLRESLATNVKISRKVHHLWSLFQLIMWRWRRTSIQSTSNPTNIPCEWTYQQTIINNERTRVRERERERERRDEDHFTMGTTENRKVSLIITKRSTFQRCKMRAMSRNYRSKMPSRFRSVTKKKSVH